MATTGVLGQRWRADVTGTGSVVPWDGSPPLDWFVAADDGWHDPKADRGVRQSRVAGTAVFETRLRIPGGDAVQRVWSVADHGGLTLVDVANDSPLPIAVAFTRPDVVTSRPPTDVPLQGVDVPEGTVVLPVGHRSSAQVALAHADARPVTLPAGVPSPDAVTRGWIARTDAASRLDLPEPALVEAVRAARCEIALTGPPERVADPDRFLLALGELARMGELIGDVAPDVAAAVTAVAARRSPLHAAALAAAGVVLAAAGERRALRDLAAIPAGPPDAPIAAVGIDAVPAVERRIAGGPVLFPAGMPPAWLGTDFEAHGLVAGPASRLSLAVRWHGPNPALLWEVTGEPVTLASAVPPDGWATSEPRGETLWVLGERGEPPG